MPARASSSRAARCRNSRSSTRTPPSPCIGSAITAATVSALSAASSSSMSRSTIEMPPASGRNGARYAGGPSPRASPNSRPWNPPRSAMISCFAAPPVARPQRRANLERALVRLRAGVAEEHAVARTCAPRASRPAARRARCDRDSRRARAPRSPRASRARAPRRRSRAHSPRCRRRSRDTPCRRRRTARRPRRARTPSGGRR